MAKKTTPPSNKKTKAPSKDEILAYIQECDHPLTKREIARAFQIKGDDRLILKKILKELKDEGHYDKKTFAPTLDLPRVCVLEISKVTEDGELLATPVQHPSSALIFMDSTASKKLKIDDRVLGSLKKNRDGTYTASVIRELKSHVQKMYGRIFKSGKQTNFVTMDRQEYSIPLLGKQANEFEEGDLVSAEVHFEREGKFLKKLQKHGHITDKDILTKLTIFQNNLPHTFPEAALKDAEGLKVPPLGDREDLREIPLVTIDDETARDFDDAVYAEPDTASDNPGGWRIIVAIADVSHYVAAGSALDQEAFSRSVSVYFPDQVIPMLPEALSNEMCSLRPNVERATLAVHMTISSEGQLKKFRFTRALIKCRHVLMDERLRACRRAF